MGQYDEVYRNEESLEAQQQGRIEESVESTQSMTPMVFPTCKGQQGERVEESRESTQSMTPVVLKSQEQQGEEVKESTQTMMPVVFPTSKVCVHFWVRAEDWATWESEWIEEEKAEGGEAEWKDAQEGSRGGYRKLSKTTNFALTTDAMDTLVGLAVTVIALVAEEEALEGEEKTMKATFAKTNEPMEV